MIELKVRSLSLIALETCSRRKRLDRYRLSMKRSVCMHTCYSDPAAADRIQNSRTCLEHTAMSQHRELDVTKRDRFELLSAYLDGEVTSEERRLVATWLDEDPETQGLYQRLLQLRQGFHGICGEGTSGDASQAMAKAVINKLNHRFRLTCMAGMTAAAVATLGIFSGALNTPLGPQQIVQSSNSQENLKIALDQPPIAIPKPTLLEAATQSGVGISNRDNGVIESAL
jgi:anti-sigma factor RsiW